MKFRTPLSWAFCLTVGVLSVSSLHAQQDGEFLFQTYCANCHEVSDGQEERAPGRGVLRQMTPEHILDVLENGIMRTEARERSRMQRRILAEYLSGKAFGDAAPDLIPESAFCSAAPALGGEPVSNLQSGPQWNGWGATITNTRFQTAADAGLTAEDVPRLELKWAFGYPGATSGGTQPVVVGGRLYVGTAEGDVFALDAKTGCVYWAFETEAGVRTAIGIGEGAQGKQVAYFGDQSANMYAVDAQSGTLLWKVKVDAHPRAGITAAPALHANRLYVPVASREESQVDDLVYPCCTFRGSMLALDASNGDILWRTYTISEEADSVGENSIGTQMWGPSGSPIWNTPAVDLTRRLLYSGTGNNYSVPATHTSDAVVAFDMDSGRIRWINQVKADDVWNRSCGRPEIRNIYTCPDTSAPDVDFAASPILAELQDGRQIIIAANKARIYALDPDREGEIIWQTGIGENPNGGGVMWGAAVDGEVMYAANQRFDAENPDSGGGVHALEIRSGNTIWSVPAPSCENRTPCRSSRSAAVTAIPGVVFSGTMDGRFQAISTSEGTVLWEYDTSKSFETINGVKANGGSMSNAGATVVDGMLFTNSGYSHHGAITPGNVLLVFSVE